MRWHGCLDQRSQRKNRIFALVVMLSRRQTLWAGAIGGVGALLAGVITAQYQLHQSHEKDDALWNLTLNTPSGAPLKLAAFQGQPLLIHFWATWCAPCIEELPVLNQFYLRKQQEKSNQLQLLAIAIDNPSSVVKFLEKVPINIPIAIATAGALELTRQLGNAKGGLPYSVLMSQEGAILMKKEGQLKANDLSLIETLLSKA